LEKSVFSPLPFESNLRRNFFQEKKEKISHLFLSQDLNACYPVKGGRGTPAWAISTTIIKKPTLIGKRPSPLTQPLICCKFQTNMQKVSFRGPIFQMKCYYSFQSIAYIQCEFNLKDYFSKTYLFVLSILKIKKNNISLFICS